MWAWQFESNPFGFPFDPVVMVDEYDKVAGFNGVMPVMVIEKGVERSALWSCDFFIAGEWRGQGLGRQIKHELHCKSSLVMAFGISDKASEVLHHLGWVQDTSVESYRMVRKPGGLRSWAFMTLQLANRILRGRVFLPRQAAQEEGISLSVKSSLPLRQKVDALWHFCASTYERAIVRDYRYLDWRYQKHPLGRYAFVRAETERNLLGVLVVRVYGEHLRIVDYVGAADDLKLKQALVSYAVDRWRHVTQISAVTSDNQFGECLLAAGFLRLRNKPRFFRREQEPSDAKWFIMAGDSDGEFLQAGSDFCQRGPL
jgi:GNAT superfamily N-acetyltransferase